MANSFDVDLRLADLRAQIMAAVLGEAQWEDFLGSLCRLLPNGAATLFYHDSSRDRGAFSIAAGMSESALKSYAEHYCSLNPWMEAATRRPIGLSVPDSAMFDREALTKTEFYNDYRKPNDLQGAMGVTIHRKDDCHFFLSVLGDASDTSENREALFALRALVPDLRRSFEFYQRSSTGHVQDHGDERLGVLVLGPGRTVRVARGEATSQLNSGYAMSSGPTGRVEFRDPRIAARVDNCLAAVCAKWVVPAPRVFLAAQPSGPPVKLTVMTRPWDQGERYFRGPECVVLVDNPKRGNFDLQEAARLFGFTPRETEVACALLAGKPTQDLAAELGISIETVRSHIRSLFAKTETHSQAEMVALMAKCAT